MWKRRFARWRRGQAVKKHPPTSIRMHLHTDDSSNEWTVASSHERREREVHTDLATNDEVLSGQRVGPLVEGTWSCPSQHAYVYEPSPPEKTKFHYFWFSTLALQVYFCIFLAIISRDVGFLHGISLALGFQMLMIILEWVKCISRSSDLRDIKKYFSWSIRMPIMQLEQSMEGGAFRRSIESAALFGGLGLSKLMNIWSIIWSISRSHMHALNRSLVTECQNWVRQEDEMYKSYVEEQEVNLVRRET
jgi:hypothetical protein